MRTELSLAACLLFGAGACAAYAQADNLEPFLSPMSHPICGLNPDFDERPLNVPTLPFATCRTLAIGYSVNESYPDPGVDALSKLIDAMFGAGVWDQRFEPMNGLPLECKPARPLGFPQGPPRVPICTRQRIQYYLKQFEARPDVSSFRSLEARLRDLDLKDNATVQKLRQAIAAIQVAGPSISFDEISELLK